MYIALCAAYSRRPAVKRDVVAAATADRDCEHLSILSPLKVQAARHSLPLRRPTSRERTPGSYVHACHTGSVHRDVRRGAPNRTGVHMR